MYSTPLPRKVISKVVTANIPDRESSMQSEFVLRGTSLRAGICHRRESRKRKGNWSCMPPKAVRRKTIYLEILLKAILALKDLKTDELCAAVTEDHVLNVCLIFLTKFQNLLLQHILSCFF